MPLQTPYLISADWLHQHKDAPNIRIVDASWYLGSGHDPHQQFAAAHIPGAVFFDQEKIVDPTSHLPHTLPSPADFATAVGEMGISEQNKIIVYEREGYFAAPRVWWLFQLMGAEEVYVLDGGLAGWLARGFEVSSTPTQVKPAIFKPNFQAQLVVDLAQMREVVAKGSCQIADARGAPRFYAQVPEPRPSMRSGHMPGARNVPYTSLVQDGYLKPLAELRKVFTDAGIDVDKPVVTSCGSGVTAAILTLALQALGNKGVRLYDGSWSEWGALADTPVEQG